MILSHLYLQFILFSTLILISVSPVMSGPIPANLTEYVPVGKTFFGVKFPTYNEQDELQSVMEAEAITRTNQGYFDITKLKVRLFVNNKVRTTIEMEEAVYDIEKSTLESKATEKQPKVIDMDFKMTGDTMTVNTVKQVTTMKGNVRVVIPNAKKLAKGFDLSQKN